MLKTPTSVFALLLLLLLGSAAGAAECPFTQERAWGTDGYGPGQFVAPTGLAIGLGGEVYVTDHATSHVQVFDGSGNFLRMWGSPGNAPGQFEGMGDIAISSDGSVFVADPGSHRIQKFTSAGVFVHDWGGLGSGPGQFRSPFGMAISPIGELYVTDPSQNRVQVFTLDGTYLRQFGEAGVGAGQFQTPYYVAIDRTGNVLVSEYDNHRVQLLTSSGFPITQWGSYCNTGVEDTCSGGFNFPKGLCASQTGEVFVADEGNRRVEQFTSNGGFICELGGYQLPDGLFGATQDVALDSAGSMFVIDQIGRVIKFVRTPVPAKISSWGSVKAAYR